MTDPVGKVAGAPGPPEPGARSLREAAEAFESLFVRLLVQQMREAQLEEGFFGGGAGSSVYEGLFAESLAAELTRSSPLGIADLLLERWGGDPAAAGRADEALRELRGLAAGRMYELVGETGEITGVSQVPGRRSDAFIGPAGGPVRATPAEGDGDVDRAR